VWCVRLVWIVAEPALADPAHTMPALILYPPPSTSSAVALEALERAGRRWHIVYASTSLSGLNAAALAGLGVCVQCDGFAPAGLSEVPRPAQLPELGSIEFVSPAPGAPCAALPMRWRQPNSTTPIDYRATGAVYCEEGKSSRSLPTQGGREQQRRPHGEPAGSAAGHEDPFPREGSRAGVGSI